MRNRAEMRALFSPKVALASLLLAVAVSCFYWYAPFSVHWRVLDFVPSAFALILPDRWQSGFHAYFRNITYCFPGEFWWESMRYLRTAIPAYTLLFFAAITAVRLASRVRRS